MKRDQLDYVQFDVGFFSKPKHKALKYKFGNMSLLCLVSVLCDMGAATNAEVDTDVFYATCADYEIQNSSDLLDYLLQNGILFLAENGKLSNTRVVKDQESIANKREQWRDRQNKNRDKGVSKGRVTRDNGVTLKIMNTEDHEDLNLKKEKDKLPELPKLEPVFETEAEREIFQAAENALEKDQGQPWTLENSYIGAGRRPLKNYPLIRLTASGFAHIIKTHETNGLSTDDTKEALKKVEIKLQSFREQGKKIDYANAESWLVGWAMNEQLEKKINVNRLVRSTQVLNGKAVYAK